MANPTVWQLSLDSISISEIRRWPERAGPHYPHRVILKTRGQTCAAQALDEFLNASWLQDSDLDFLPQLLNLIREGSGVNLREEGTALRHGERLHIYPVAASVPAADVDYAEFCEVVRLNLRYLHLRRFWVDRPLSHSLEVRGLPYYESGRGFRVRQRS